MPPKRCGKRVSAEVPQRQTRIWLFRGRPIARGCSTRRIFRPSSGFAIVAALRDVVGQSGSNDPSEFGHEHIGPGGGFSSRENGQHVACHGFWSRVLSSRVLSGFCQIRGRLYAVPANGRLVTRLRWPIYDRIRKDQSQPASPCQL